MFFITAENFAKKPVRRRRVTGIDRPNGHRKFGDRHAKPAKHGARRVTWTIKRRFSIAKSVNHRHAGLPVRGARQPNAWSNERRSF